MEKICTRCNFRNPAARRVCQVCGFAKFSLMATGDVAVAKQPVAAPTPLALTELVEHTMAVVAATIEKLAHPPQKANHSASSETKIEPLVIAQTVSQLPAEPVAVAPDSSFESNDLDSMMAWFKSYGVDKPLILETRSDEAKAA